MNIQLLDPQVLVPQSDYLALLFSKDCSQIKKEVDPILGQLKPVVVHRVDDQFQVVIGQTMLSNWPKNQKIGCVVLPTETPVKSVCNLMIEENGLSYQARPFETGFFLGQLRQNPRLKPAFESCAKALGVSAYPELPAHVGRFLTLPEPVQQFCTEKRLAFKQIVALTYVSPDILKLVLDWRSKIPLSTQMVLTLWMGLHDLTRSGQSLTDIKTKLWQDIDPTAPPQQKAHQLMQAFQALRHPELATMQSKMVDVSAAIDRPAWMNIDWDPSFENRELRLSAKVASPDDIDQWAEFSQKSANQLKAALDLL